MLLDLDGTVVDTHELMFRCFSHSLQAHLKCEANRELWDEHSGLPLDRPFQAVCERLGEDRNRPTIADLIQTYRSHMIEIHDREMRSFPGLTETLCALRQRGIRLGIVTTKHRKTALRHLDFLGLTRLFEVIVAGDECTRLKPDPQPFLMALEAMSLSPDRVVGVGDSSHDVHGARAAGLLAAAACWGTTNRTALLGACPDRVLEQPEDLLLLAG